jgi:hypothetical protein
MELELFATKKVIVRVLIDEKDLLLDMKKRNFNADDIATVREKFVVGEYQATFNPEFFDGNEGTVFIEVDGYEFRLPAQQDVR